MLTIRDRLRASSVNRWHTLGNINRAQNIAEHSFSMAMLSEELLVRLYKSVGAYPSTDELYLVLNYCIKHDLPKILVGDEPAPYRAFLRKNLDGFSELLEKIEFECVPELKELEAAFKKHPLLAVICKACDCIEAYHFITLNGNKLGDADHVEIVQEKLLDAITKIKIKGSSVAPMFDWHEIDYVMEYMLFGDSALIDFEKEEGIFGRLNNTVKNNSKTT